MLTSQRWATVAYFLLDTLVAGLRGQFQPEPPGYRINIFTAILVEILGLSLGTYLSISNTSQLLDLVAYGGYRLLCVMVMIAVVEFANQGRDTSGWIG